MKHNRSTPAPLGYQIRLLRKRRGLTLKQLAEAVGTSVPAMHRYEGGWERYSLTTLRKIAEALQADLEIQLIPQNRYLREEGVTPQKPRAGTLAKHLAPLFWDKPLAVSDLDRYTSWILKRVLTAGNIKQVREAVAYFGMECVEDVIEDRGIDPKTRSFWKAVLEH